MNKKCYKKVRRKTLWLVSLICAVFGVSFAYASAGSLQTKPEKIGGYLKKLEQVYPANVVYEAADMSKSSAQQAPVEEFKAFQVFLALPKGKSIGFQQASRVVLKSEKQPAFLPQQDVVVRGMVRDNKTKNPMPGVSVSVKGTSNVVITNDKGEYQITVKEDAVLVFRFIGYKTEEVIVGHRTRVDLFLAEETSVLEEVVVSTGYQNLNRKLFTGSAVSLKGMEVKQEGIIDVSRMLEGRAAGVSIQNVSGTFGTAPKIHIRGATSITGENKPLWVIDGVILEDVVNISNEQLSSGDRNTLLGSSVAGLNADDIESFTILKDAAATAQYGARAMNGVVVVVTKKGRIGKPLVSYTSNFSTYLKPVYDDYNIMNSADQMSVYAEMGRKGWFNFGKTSRFSDGGVYTRMAHLINYYDKTNKEFGVENTPEDREAYLYRYATVNTDWFDILFKNSLLQEHSLSVSTGNEKSRLYFSTSYLNDNGWALGNSVERYTGNINAVFNLSDNFSVNFITTGAIRNQKAPGALNRESNPVEGKYSRDFDINPYSYSLNASRTLTAFDQNGNRENFTRNFADFNILTELENNLLELSMQDLKFQGGLNYKFLKKLKYDFLASMRYVKSSAEHKVKENSNMPNAYRAAEDAYTQDNNRFLFRDPLHPEEQPISVLPYGGFYIPNEDFLRAYLIRNSVEYDNVISDKHVINVYASQEMRLANRQTKSMIGYGYQYDKGGVPYIEPDIVRQAILENLNYYSTNYQHDRFASFMARVAYSYDGTYSFNATGRYDGSNKLGTSPTARWLPTWNVSGAWYLDKENFFKGLLPIVNKATIRATYGLTASLGSATNSSLVLRAGNSLRPHKYEKESVLNIEAIENKDLTWEKQYEANLGMDLAFLNDKLNLTVDLYHRKGFDLISPIKTSGITGQYIKNANYADMNSKGVEVTLSGSIIKTKNWNWKGNFNFGYNKNKVVRLSSPQNIFSLITGDGGPQEGFPYRGLYSVEFTGLRHEDGVPEFINEKGERSIDVYLQSYETKYLKYEGPTDPKLTGGFYNSINYKGFTLGALFTFAAGNKIRLNPVFSASYSDLDAMPNEFKDRWIKPGDELKTNVPSILEVESTGKIGGAYPYNVYNYSTVRVADGGFIRLKQLLFSYALPSRVLKKIGAGNASLSLVANNFWLLYSDKKLKGQDPEFFTSGGVALPIPKQYTLSLKVGF